jgi:hypothetical protein
MANSALQGDAATVVTETCGGGVAVWLYALAAAASSIPAITPARFHIM